MLLTITNTQSPSQDLGYLLHKNPAKLQSFDLTFGRAHVFYPAADADRCTAALLLDVDPVGLVRNRKGPAGEGYALEQYVNDRPYVASSFLSVAIAKVYHSALQGVSKERPELAEAALPLEARISVLPCRGGEGLLRKLFEPLGYAVDAQGHTLDERFPGWGESPYYTVTLKAVCRLRDLLAHLYVLLPVLDNDKHYWVGDAEVEKLLLRGAGWLSSHPERDLITLRYLKHRRTLADDALARLTQEEAPEPDLAEEKHAEEEAALEKRISLNTERMAAVLSAVHGSGAKRVIDLGCGEGRFLRLLIEDHRFEAVTGVDVSHRALERAEDRLKLDRMPPKRRERLTLQQGALTYRDKRLAGYDAATVIEVIEHLDLYRLSAFERVLFEFARPGTIIVTTPNVEYNAKFENLPAGKLRHKDHRFEWTRAEFETWAAGVASRFGYTVNFFPIGPVDESLGAPTQMAIFTQAT
jgi:3' terminal RNA ribose 2'-O-methyltransferase Hen1